MSWRTSLQGRRDAECQAEGTSRREAVKLRAGSHRLCCQATGAETDTPPHPSCTTWARKNPSPRAPGLSCDTNLLECLEEPSSPDTRHLARS